MALIKFWVVLLFAFLPTTNGIVVSCPFNTKECNCTLEEIPSDYIYQYVNCESSTFPTFIRQSSQRYTVTQTMTINGGVDVIPAYAFSTFNTIETLELVHDSNKPIQQQWNENAFLAVSIHKLAVSGLAGMIPLPVALAKLATRAEGLAKLSIDNGGPCQLSANIFPKLTRLTELTISNTPITAIDPNAFTNLQSTLTSLVLSGTNLGFYPADALEGLKNLRVLSLDNNTIRKFPTDKPFLVFPNLESLDLSNNVLAPSILVNRSLNDLPPNLTSLHLKDVGLTEVPFKKIKENSNFELYLDDNSIKTIRSDAFKNGDKLKKLSLRNNPITTIEPYALSHLTAATDIDLRNLQLTNIDLAMFPANIPDTTEVYWRLGDSSFIKTLTVTDSTKVPQQAHILISFTNLQTIDKSIDDLMLLKPAIILDLNYNRQLICVGLEWLAKYLVEYVSGIPRVICYGARCADKNQSLEKYLEPFEYTSTLPTTTLQSIGNSTTSTGNNFGATFVYSHFLIALVILINFLI